MTAPAPVAQPLKLSQLEDINKELDVLCSLGETVIASPDFEVIARAVERACAEAWGVKLVEATGQEGTA